MPPYQTEVPASPTETSSSLQSTSKHNIMSDNNSPQLLEIPHPSSRISFEAIEQQLASRRNDALNPLRAPPQAQRTPSTLPEKTIAAARDQIFHLGSVVGQLCASFLSSEIPRDSIGEVGSMGSMTASAPSSYWKNPSPEKERIEKSLGDVFVALFDVASVCGIDLCTSILKKVDLNGRKYPVELCKGKSGKYTKYSKITGITKTEGQSTVNTPVKKSSSLGDSANEDNYDETMSGDDNKSKTNEEDTTTIEGITLLIRNFSSDRLWNRYHTPRNIALALLGEVGELAELFQWCGDGTCNDNQNEGGKSEACASKSALDGWTEEEIDKVGQEMADVSIYLIRLADVCHVRLGQVAMALVAP